jgi:hypothetical protein
MLNRKELQNSNDKIYYPFPQNFHLHRKTFNLDYRPIGDQQISQKLKLDLEVYSATSLAKDDDLSSSNVVGES